MDVFKAEINAMQDKAPYIQKSLGIGIVPLFIGNLILDDLLDN
jgi:hypothetical protein